MTFVRHIDQNWKGFSRSVFDAHDLDRNGTIDAAELQASCELMGEGITLAEAREVIKSMDDKGFGSLVFDDLVHWLRAKSQPLE
jgi:Ca2+-binding EF-hand superfamily protein